MEYKCKELDDAFECSELMLTEAKAGNWEKVIAVEKQRGKILEKIFSRPLEKSEKQLISEKTLQILEINKKLEAISSKARDEIRSQAGSINKGRHALDMYAQHT